MRTVSSDGGTSMNRDRLISPGKMMAIMPLMTRQVVGWPGTTPGEMTESSTTAVSMRPMPGDSMMSARSSDQGPISRWRERSVAAVGNLRSCAMTSRPGPSREAFGTSSSSAEVGGEGERVDFSWVHASRSPLGLGRFRRRGRKGGDLCP